MVSFDCIYFDSTQSPWITYRFYHNNVIKSFDPCNLRKKEFIIRSYSSKGVRNHCDGKNFEKTRKTFWQTHIGIAIRKQNKRVHEAAQGLNTATNSCSQAAACKGSTTLVNLTEPESANRPLATHVKSYLD